MITAKISKQQLRKWLEPKLTVKEESNEDWRKLALALKTQYETAPQPNSDAVPVSELFLVGINNLYEREQKIQTKRAKIY